MKCKLLVFAVTFFGGYISCVDTSLSSIRNVNYILYIVLIHLVVIFKNNFVIRFEFFTAVIVQVVIFWIVTPCSCVVV
jgi:hypothetical protein